jgi:L,D-peptidoglycan transpeptidase YkuD (ErfK/YbiS/YcfS/YnhG family)
MNLKQPVAVVLCLIHLLVLGCQHRWPAGPSQACLTAVAPESRQVVVVMKEESAPSAASIHLYGRKGNLWQPIAGPLPAMVGRNGLAPPGEKREGDGRTPSGVFPLGRAFGYETLPTSLPYLVLTPDMIWVDDPTSPFYNRLVEKQMVGQGVSHEIMRRNDDLYKYGIVIVYNTQPVVAGFGSAIFFHIWRDGRTPTSGCVAMAEADMLTLLRWLDPVQQPVTVIGQVCP